jgi:hypothetical protein
MGSGNIAAGESRAVASKRVDVRREDISASMEANVCIADVVSDDEENIRFAGH